jgi:integrase
MTPAMKRKKTQKVNFTKRALEALPIPSAGRLIVVDTQTAGLGLTIFASGVKTFFHRRFADGSAERTTLGSFEELSILQARGKAAELNSKLAQWKLAGFEGPNPLANPARTGATFNELLEAYILGRVRPEANNPVLAERNLRWMAKRYFTAWGPRRIDSITVRDLLTVRNGVAEKHKYQANRIVETVKAIFGWSAKKDKDGNVNFWPVENPARDVGLYDEDQHDRFLQPHELVKFNEEVKKESHRDLRDFLVLSLATGARKSNLLAMRWADLSFERANWNIPLNKSGKPYDAHLTRAALQVLRRRRAETPEDAVFVFPSRGKSGHLTNLKKVWDRFRKRAGIPDVRIHELRRTKGSYMAISGESLQKIGAVLGHRSLESTEIYARLLQDSVREAIANGDAAMNRMTRSAKARMKLAARQQKLLLTSRVQVKGAFL